MMPEVIEFFKNEDEFNMVTKEHLQDFIEHSTNPRKSFTALNNGKIIGAVLVDFDTTSNRKTNREITVLRVDPKFREKGVATELVMKVESAAMNNAIDYMIVQVFKQLKTHEFWKKRGYALINILKEGSLEVYMYRKKL
jgi:GNAT superfamily N-acetyltransferase